MGARAFGLWLWALVGTSPLAAQEFTTFKGHGGPVMGLCVLQTSGEVVSASFDNSVGVWQGRMPRWFEGHAAAVIAVAELGEGRLVSGGDDFALIVWDRATGQGRTQRQGCGAGCVAGWRLDRVSELGRVDWHLACRGRGRAIFDGP